MTDDAEVLATPLSDFMVVMSAISRGKPVIRACAEAGVNRQAFYAALGKYPTLADAYGEALREQTRARFVK